KWTLLAVNLMHVSRSVFMAQCFFFFNDPATADIYTLSLHDALPIFSANSVARRRARNFEQGRSAHSTRESCPREHSQTALRLRRSEEHTSDSSHDQISYAVFCLKKKQFRSHP